MQEVTPKQQKAYNDYAKALFQASEAAVSKRKLVMPTMDPEGWFKTEDWAIRAEIPVEFAYLHKTHKGHLALKMKREIVFVEDAEND